jgi:hypothetical protein
MNIEYLDRPPAGWFVLSVMRKERRGWDWIAWMSDADPGDDCPRGRHPCCVMVRIPGKHRSRDAAWGALEDMIATRH